MIYAVMIMFQNIMEKQNGKPLILYRYRLHPYEIPFLHVIHLWLLVSEHKGTRHSGQPLLPHPEGRWGKVPQKSVLLVMVVERYLGEQ